MILPNLDGLAGCTFLIDGPFGKTIQTLVGVDMRDEFRLVFTGHADGDDTIWGPPPRVLRHATLIGRPS